MKLTKQSSTVWGETPYTKKEGILWVEKAGRVCYRSEDKIVEGSGQKFVENIIKRKHFSVIEHSNIVIRMRKKCTFPAVALVTQQSAYNSKYFSFCIHKDRVYISGNWRAWIEWYSNVISNDITLGNLYDILETSMFEVVTDPNDVPYALKAITVEFTTNRAVTHELVRHRPASYSQESQRYCRYGDIDFIEPVGYDKWDAFDRNVFDNSCTYTQYWYKTLLINGKSPQEARNVLTNTVATKIIMTAYLPEWKHIFNLRCSKAADPQMVDVMVPVFKEFVQRGMV